MAATQADFARVSNLEHLKEYYDSHQTPNTYGDDIQRVQASWTQEDHAAYAEYIAQRRGR